MKHLFSWLVSGCICASGGNALAVDLSGDRTLTLSGFYNLTGAKVVGGKTLGNDTPWQFREWKCPCSVAMPEYGAVYEKSRGFQFDQESLLGIQLNKDFSSTLSATAQFVSRSHNPSRGTKPTVDWLYATWRPSTESAWTFQAGKMRIPLYYYSDYLYIGYAYPWVRPAADVYGQEMFSYQGANASYRTEWGNSGWVSTATVWVGSETDKNNVFASRITYSQPTGQSWKRMHGAWISLGNGVVEMRVMTMRMKESMWQEMADGSRDWIVSDSPGRFVGLAMNVDYFRWFVKTEIDRYRNTDDRYDYGLGSIGYKWGVWTPAYTFSRYRTASLSDGRRTHAASLRWDFRENTAVKLQLERSWDEARNANKEFGNSTLMSVSLQGIF